MPPVNDDFANATVLTGRSGTVPFSNVDATEDVDDPWGGGASVWFKWTAPASYTASFVIKDLVDVILLYLVLYEAGDGIETVTFIDYTEGHPLAAEVVEGTEYYIAIDQSYRGPGSGTLRWGEATGHWSEWLVPAPVLRPYRLVSVFGWRTLRIEQDNLASLTGADYEAIWAEAINRTMPDTGFGGNNYGDPGGQHKSTAYYHDRGTGGGSYLSGKATAAADRHAASAAVGVWGWAISFDLDDHYMEFNFDTALLYRDPSPAALDELSPDQYTYEPASGDLVQYESDDPNEVLGGHLQCVLASIDLLGNEGGEVEVRYTDSPVVDWSPTQPSELLDHDLLTTLAWDSAGTWLTPGIGTFSYDMGVGLVEMPGLGEHVEDGRLGLLFYRPRTTSAPAENYSPATAMAEAALWVQMPRYRYWALEWAEDACPPRLAATCRMLAERVRPH